MSRFVPLYERLKTQIRDDFLADAESREGAPLPTERELQRRYGVSRPTISKALAALAAEGLVVKAQGRGSFIARSDPSGGNGVSARRIGFVASITSAELVQRAFHGIRRSAHRRGHHVLVADGPTPEAERLAIRELVEAGVRGIVLYPAIRHRPDAATDYLAHDCPPLPLVVIDTGLTRHRVPQVVFDNRRAGYEATEYLLHRGRRRIAIALWDQVFLHPSLEQRLAGYQDALLDRGIEADPRLVRRFHPASAASDMAEIVRAWDRDGVRPDAVIAADDTSAIDVVTALERSGKRVPDEVQVFGFDNRLEARHFRPTFPTTNPNFEWMGECACDILFDVLEEGCPTERTFVLPVPILARRTTGASVSAQHELSVR